MGTGLAARFFVFAQRRRALTGRPHPSGLRAATFLTPPPAAQAPPLSRGGKAVAIFGEMGQGGRFSCPDIGVKNGTEEPSPIVPLDRAKILFVGQPPKEGFLGF